MRKLFQSKADANGRYRGENGSYNAATNTIRLDVNAGAYNAGELSQVTLLRTMSHELTHALQQNSPAQYEALKHAVLDVLTSKSGASIEEMAARKMEQDSSLKKPDVALDEVVAEACENMLRDSDAMEQLIAQHPAEAKTFLEKVKKFFTDVVNAIRAAFGGSGTSRSREATALMQQAEEYLDICEKWSKALQDTAEISGRMDRQTGDGDVQYSLRDGIEFMEDKYYARLLDNLDAQNNNGYIRVGSVKSGSVLSKVGLPATNLYFDVSKIEKALSAHGDHIDIDILKGIPSILRNPTVISEANVANTVNVFGEMQIGNSPIMVGIVVTPDRSGKNVINKVRTVHARRDIGNVITDSNVLYLSPDKKRTRTWFQARGNVVPLGGTRFGFIRSIAPSDGSVKFSLRENVEQTKDLLAVHNLTEKNLLDALNLGGLPSPSIAIVKAKNGHSKYGPISIVFDKSSIDPQVKGNRVYGSDAWTPTAPKVEVEANEKAATRLRNKYYELARQVGYDKARPFYPYANELEESLNRNGGEAGIIENHLDDTKMMNLFLADTGRSMVDDISKETVTRIPEEKVRLYDALISGMGEDVIRELYPVNNESPMATRRRWLENHGEQLERVYLEYASENGIDTQDFAVKRLMPQLVQARNYLANGAETRTTEFDSEATDKAIRSAVNQKEYAAWLHQLFDGAEGRKGIYNGKDVVDSRGNRRTWNQLHYAYTLENIVKAMNAVQSARGQGLWGANATGLQAMASPEYKNISEIKADSSRLGAVDEATYAERVQAVDQAIGRVISKITGGSNSPMANDNAATALKSAALTTKTVNAIVKSFAQDGYTIDTQTAKEIQDVYKAASAIPTEYFEAKPQRAVYFDEVKYAVVPDSLNPEVLSRLEALVPDVRTYADGDEAQRLELLNQRQDLQFQMRDEEGGDQGLVGMFDETPRLGEAHIDQRTWENMSDRRVHSFMNDYPASRMWLARMASVLQSDVSASTAGQRFMNEEGTFMGQKRDTTPLLAEMKDSGYTWQQMSDVFGKMAEVFENGDLEGRVPETALWKRAELILDRAVTEGYTDMNGIEYRPDAGYMRYKDELPGAKAREIPANAVEDTFEDVDNRIAGGENAAVQTGDGERVQLQGDTAYQEKQRSAKSGIALMDGGPSNRELLSSALESAAQTPEELRYVQSYKKQAQKIAEMEGLLVERRAEVQQLQDMKSRTADQEIRMKNLQQSIAETESMIDKRDKGLLKMEAMEPLRNVLDRERANYRETLKQAKKDAAARQREKDAAKLDNALLATQMHEGREWAAKLHEAENRVAEANQKVEDLKAKSLADRMYESRKWAEKVRNAEDRVAKANWKLEEVQAQSLADRMHESSEWAAKLRKAEDQLAAAKRQLETAQMQRIAERMAEGRKWANEKLLKTITISRSFGTPSGARTLDTLIKSQV
ncbi:MAG: hypothetical protein Q4C31_09315, partial [Eubacteriales bacterium]|nr:hypothetical protein [Eubacteriales bacterium]